jgi:VWFA-related protein
MLKSMLAIAALVLCLCGVGMSQDPKGDKLHSISVDVTRVVLYATVREDKAGIVGDLAKEQFTVQEDGKPQEILSFNREDVPVAIGLLVDNSGSMMNKRPQVIEAAKSFLRATNPLDEIFVLHFNESLTYGLPSNVPFTSDHVLLG